MTHQQRTWHKSTYSGASGNCVEVAEGPTTGVRDTRYRGLAELSLPNTEWSALLHALRTN